jgi:hypothetical protein
MPGRLGTTHQTYDLVRSYICIAENNGQGVRMSMYSGEQSLDRIARLEWSKYTWLSLMSR